MELLPQTELLSKREEVTLFIKVPLLGAYICILRTLSKNSLTTKKTILIVAFFTLLHHLLFSQTQETILHARIWLDGKTMLDLEKADLEIDHGFYETGLSFRSDFAASELSRAKAAGFRIDTLEADVVAKYLLDNAIRKPVWTSAGDRGASPCDGYEASTATPINYTYGTMGGYYTYEEFLAILDDMQVKFPDLISARQPVSNTLLTHQGRRQWYVRISDNPNVNEAEPEGLYTALHHAREPNSLTHLIYFMWHLLENYDRDPELRYLVDNTELYFIPCLNPDEYIYNQTNSPDGGGFWRKNRRDNGDGSIGVDLNRNYSYNWGELGTAPIQVSFEALTANIIGFSSVIPISINDFETASFSVSVTLSNAVQTGESILFVASTERNGQVHRDTFETIFNPTPYTALLFENNETTNNQWITGLWGPTTAQSYSPSKSMTDSPNASYIAEENTLTTAAPLSIPSNSTEARLRFFTQWDIELGLDWAQVLISTG